jgi:hypothetical protein
LLNVFCLKAKNQGVKLGVESGQILKKTLIINY